MSVGTSVLNKLMLARHLFWMARDNLNSHREIALFAAVNLLQDAVEAFLLAASEHVNAGIAARTGFDEYFSKIDKQIDPIKLPFQPRLFALNKARVLSKHNGVRPHREELEDFIVVCREFFEESCSAVFGLQFWSLSLLELLDDGEIKELLRSAERAYENGDWANCILDCRKLFFIEFEKKYDISEFRDSNHKGMLGPFTNAPFYTRNAEYIKESVHTPFDYIVLDHSHLQSSLMSEGIDPQIFWNIWRLTPQVYRFPNAYGAPTNEWYVKEEFEKKANATEDNSSYVLEQSIDVALHLSQRRKRERVSGHKLISVVLKREEVNLYENADRNGPVSAKTPPGVRRLLASFGTIGLNGVEHYWSVWRMHKDTEGNVSFLSGFVHSDEVDRVSEVSGDILQELLGSGVN